MDYTAIIMGLLCMISGLIINKNAKQISQRNIDFETKLTGFKYYDYVSKSECCMKVGSYFFIILGLIMIILEC